MSNTMFELLFDFKVDRGGVNAQLNQMRDDIKGFTQRIKDENAIKFSDNVGDIKARLDDIRKQLATAKKSGDFDLQVKLNSDIARTSNELAQAQKELRNYARTGSADISVLGKNFDSVNKSIERQGSLIQQALGKLRTGFGGLGSLVLGAFSIGAATSFVKTMFDITSQVQQAKIAFTKLSGSAETANKLFKDIQTFAANTPFDQLGLVDGAKRLLAYGFNAKQVIPVMNSLGNAVAATGGGQDSLNGVIVALGQMQTKGKLVQQELNQIAERGIPVFDILRTKLGLTREQMAKVGEQGISSAEAIPAILEGINERFGGVMAEQSKTLQGQLSNLIDIFKQNMGELGGELAPIFASVIGLLKTIVEPAFNVLILGVRAFKVVFEATFSGISAVYTFFANNFVVITKFISATFLSALVYMNKQAIFLFIEGAVKNILKGMTLVYTSMITGGKAVMSFVMNLRVLILETARSTLAWIRDTTAKVTNTIATRSQILRNNIATLSFRALGKSIMQTVLNLLLLASRFFLIGSIVAVIVAVIYSNRSKLSSKLKPVFEFMAKVGAAAPGVIAKAWNSLVGFIGNVVTGILSSTARVAKAIEDVTGVSIGSDKIAGASNSFKNFADGLKITEQDVSGVFASIKDGAIGAFDAIKGTVTGGGITKEMTDIGGAFGGMGDSAERAGKQAKGGGKATSEATKEATKGIKDATDASKAYEKTLDKLEKATNDLKDANTEYKDAVIKNNNEIVNKMRDAQKEYDKTIKKIIETRDEELKSIDAKKAEDKNKSILDFAKDQADEYAKSLQKVKDLQKKSASEDDATKRAEIEGDISQELQAQEQIQKNLIELKKSGAESDAKTIDSIVREAQYRAGLTEQERAIYDFKQKQLNIDNEAKNKVQEANQKFIDDKTKALQELENVKASIETQKNIIAELDKVKFITKKQVDDFLDGDKFKTFDEESQKVFEELLKIKLKISEAGTDKTKASTEAKQAEIELERQLGDLQKKNLKDVKDKYDELLTQVSEIKSKSGGIFDASNAVSTPVAGIKRKGQDALGGIDAVDPNTVIATQKELTDGKMVIKVGEREFEATLATAKKAEDADKYLNEQNLHSQTVTAIQNVTQNALGVMQGSRQAYYGNIVNLTRSSVSSMIAEYNRLSQALRETIALQSQANRSSTAGFANGGFTGSGGKYDVAGVVHKGEYVVPKRMVQKYGGVVSQLENTRVKGFADGGYTNTTNRAVNVNGPINIGGEFDFDRAMDKWRWKI